MAVDEATVERVAHLARIRIEKERLAPLAEELSGILAWVEQLGKIDTDGIEPMTSAIRHRLRWRTDDVTDGDKREDILANAPAIEHGFFAVPKVIE